MNARSDRETDETYGTDEVYHHDEDPYRETGTAAGESESPVPYLPGAPWGGWPFGGGSDDEAGYDEYGREEYGDASGSDEDDASSGRWGLWDESLITLLVVGGAILFLFPEPATSGLGILLVGIGVVAWLVDWAT